MSEDVQTEDGQPQKTRLETHEIGESRDVPKEIEIIQLLRTKLTTAEIVKIERTDVTEMMTDKLDRVDRLDKLDKIDKDSMVIDADVKEMMIETPN
jgi:hypothetical protein